MKGRTVAGDDYAVWGENKKLCPYGGRGDRLWVREKWQVHDCIDTDYGPEVGYILDKIPLEPSPHMCISYAADDEEMERWRPSIHMPRWASRITLEVVSVRVERLREITEEDARAEGVEHPVTWCPPEENGEQYAGRMRGLTPTFSYRAAFAHLWNGINVKRGFGWDANPWVWVVGFKVAEVRR